MNERKKSGGISTGTLRRQKLLIILVRSFLYHWLEGKIRTKALELFATFTSSPIQAILMRNLMWILTLIFVSNLLAATLFFNLIPAWVLVTSSFLWFVFNLRCFPIIIFKLFNYLLILNHDAPQRLIKTPKLGQLRGFLLWLNYVQHFLIFFMNTNGFS